MADTDTIEEKPIARAILHERSRYQWTVQVGGAKAISSHMWLRSPEQVATQMHAVGQPFSYLLGDSRFAGCHDAGNEQAGLGCKTHVTPTQLFPAACW